MIFKVAILMQSLIFSTAFFGVGESGMISLNFQRFLNGFKR
ncbi:hypothetical protein RintRC_4147 [Richelia intracellularis]|nr:hypothetical protein RintRC_4147 [Richelia intracellularis]